MRIAQKDSFFGGHLMTILGEKLRQKLKAVCSSAMFNTYPLDDIMS
jgi:hypothetical protein